MQKTQQGNLSLSGEFDSEAGTDRRGAFAQQSRGKVCLLLLLFHISRVSENHFRYLKKVDHMVGKTFSPKGVDEKIKFQGVIFPDQLPEKNRLKCVKKAACSFPPLGVN